MVTRERRLLRAGFTAGVCTILVAALHPAVAVAASCKLAKLAEFPVTMTGPRALTTARFNGVEQKLAIDSGAFYSLISGASAAELKLKTVSLPFG
jgi:hypothetical protein